MRIPRAAFVLVLLAARLAGAGGSISGILKDPSGALIPGARLTLINTALKSPIHSRPPTRRDSTPSRPCRWATTIYD